MGISCEEGYLVKQQQGAVRDNSFPWTKRKKRKKGAVGRGGLNQTSGANFAGGQIIQTEKLIFT